MKLCTLGYFGKLPAHSDFISYNASGMGIQQLDQWIQEGIHFSSSRLGVHWGKAFSQSDIWRFVVPVEEDKSFLVGLWKASRDRAGRHYPFILFLCVNRASFRCPIYLAPIGFSSFFNQAVRALSQEGQEMDVKDVTASLEQGISPMLDEIAFVEQRYHQQIQKSTTQAFWERLLGDIQNPTRGFMKKGLTEFSQFFRDMPQCGLKLPLFQKEREEDYDIPFWFDLLFRQLGQDRRTHPTFFWKRGNENPCIVNFFQRPSPRSLLFLIRPDLETDLWYDLASVESSRFEKDGKTDRNSDTGLWEDADVSMAMFLESIGRKP